MRNSGGRFLLFTASGVLALLLGACSGSSTTTSTTPTTPTTTPTLVTETFSGSIAQNGTAVYPFAVTSTGGSLMAGYTSLSPSSVTALGMGLGAWDGTTCGLNLTQNDVARSGNTAFSGTASAANYCVRVYDGGNVPADTTASFTLQVQHY